MYDASENREAPRQEAGKKEGNTESTHAAFAAMAMDPVQVGLLERALSGISM